MKLQAEDPAGGWELVLEIPDIDKQRRRYNIELTKPYLDSSSRLCGTAYRNTILPGSTICFGPDMVDSISVSNTGTNPGTVAAAIVAAPVVIVVYGLLTVANASQSGTSDKDSD